ncbi:MAG: hypothetical protein F4X98_11795 [Gammaproteobacteria bacterium]|nr:hypothetical protein [Gammaproteobacteria bacterium]
MTTVATFYRFEPQGDIDALRAEVEQTCLKRSLRGTVLLAAEGFNAALAGARADLNYLIERHFRGVAVKWSTAAPGNPVFDRLKVRQQPEIVGFGRPLAPSTPVGERVSPSDWKRLIEDPAVLIVDVRNDYESDVGTFHGAKRADTANFRDFPDFAMRELSEHKQRPIAMYCTGGIRCEKASAYLLEQGFADVRQLDGGILGYFAEVTPDNNAFEGECFVFDQRVSVTQELEQGSYELCETCGRPLSRDDSSGSSPVARCSACAQFQRRTI